ncbi:LysM peptidoglycan-binding domain-containing protein [Candidatus Palauibacter soopunensis]|uniref:LysM peptidoglycan-binding domain-containing protein n=1 Tax=Candidatus Palauibacter soopunensis TaxID=3056739 RepID=UPI002392060C|nr:LysM peptidoglycan-binding domain-containing protein [Candidatus Palauibacter soopunensis]MDE2878044.1 LysM peptidoglycan-binding domain-containing protein [Candidatus Palauibacter soopunensis]
MTKRSSKTPVFARLHWAGLVLAAFVLHGCAFTQRTPDIGPAPETANVEPGARDAGEADPPGATPEAGGASASAPAPDDELMPEDPVVPDPVDETAGGPTAAEIDRAIREMLGGDPMGLVHEGEDPRVLRLEMNERVQSWVNFFQTVIGERFATYLGRKTRYESMIRRKLREAGLPQDLIYLALIESGMNPNAYSRASAVGLWQFIAGTGRQYGLEISYWIDERRDPEKATDAAVRHLKDLYEEFGSWYLAAAAYNGGPNRVRRGLRTVPGGTFWDLADRRLLRRETRDYVPKIIAAAMIGHDPARYGFPDPERETIPEYVKVRVPDATSFDVLAEVAGTDEETINLLNPEFPRDVTPPHREVEVRVPVEGAAQFAVRYAAVPEDERVTWTFHTVQRGHTLGWIGEQYGVSVAALRAANGNVNPRRLQIGQQLVVPRSARASGASIARSSSARPITARTNAEGTTVVTVQRGQTLGVIAQRYGVSLAALRAANGNVNPRRLQIGQELLIPATGRSTGTGSAGSASNGAGPVTIVVRPGDSLWLIARRHSVSTRELIEWNRLSSTRIHPGDRLQIRR